MSVQVSIIIPTFNTGDMTLKCLEDLAEHSPAFSYEVIVVDNHSTDGTAERIRTRFPATRLIANPTNEGYGRACNIGARAAYGPYLCFLNSDTRQVGPALEQLMAWLESHPRTGLVAPKFTRQDGRIQQMSWGWNPVLFGELIQQFFAPYVLKHSRWKTWLAQRLQRHSRSVSILCGACLLMRREVFNQLNGFDPDFELYFEDSDLSLRTWKAGWRVDFCAEAAVIHHLGQSSGRRSWGLTPLIYRQSQIQYYHKHAPRWGLPLLKVYQSLKWLRIWVLMHFRPEEQPRIRQYLALFWSVITEKQHLQLKGTYFE